MRPTLPTLLAATLLPAAAHAQVPPTPVPTLAGTRLDVVAEGEALRRPDLAIVTAGVVTQAPTAAAAMADNASRMTATIAALRRAGIADRDLQTASVNLAPQYRYGENVPPVITGYQASSAVTVRFRDVKRAGPVLDALTRVEANQISGPTLTVDDPDPALDEARTKAIAKARARADLYARAAGLGVRRILAISESATSEPPVPYARLAMARAGEARSDTPVEPGEQRLAVTVNVSFELQ